MLHYVAIVSRSVIRRKTINDVSNVVGAGLSLCKKLERGMRVGGYQEIPSC